MSGGYGIYDGCWKDLGAGDSPKTLERKEKKKVPRRTGLLDRLGIYDLRQDDVDLLADAGITRYVLHNPSSSKGSNAWCPLPEGVPAAAPASARTIEPATRRC